MRWRSETGRGGISRRTQVKTDVETIASGPGQTSTPSTIQPLIASRGRQQQ